MPIVFFRKKHADTDIMSSEKSVRLHEFHDQNQNTFILKKILTGARICHQS
jgi:hypothetical protein